MDRVRGRVFVSSASPFQAASSSPVTLGGVCCRVYESKSACTRLRHDRRIIRLLFMENSRAHTRPPRGIRRRRAANGCAPADTDTHPTPRQGWTFKSGPPSHPTPTPPQQRPGPGRRTSVGRGNRVRARLHPALCHSLLPKPRAAPTQGARLQSSAPALPPRAGAVRSGGAEQGCL